MNTQTETVQYLISTKYLPAILNNDYTGLDTDERCELDNFIQEYTAFVKARHGENYISHHWVSTGNIVDYGRCDITACFDSLCVIQLIIRYGKCRYPQSGYST